MATRILTKEQVIARLAKIPAIAKVDRQRAEAHFKAFVASLKVFTEIPPIQWFDGPDDFQTRLLDQGIYYRDNRKFTDRLHQWQSTISRQLNWYHGDVPLVAQTIDEIEPSGMTSTYGGVGLYADHNYLRAIEAGLAYWIVTKTAIVLFPQPNLRFFRETAPLNRGAQYVLHSTIAPAVEYPEQPAANQYWFRGTRVPAFVITNPERITLAHIRAARSIRMRNAMIDRYGLLRYIRERGYRPTDIDETNGCILHVKGGRRSYGGWNGGGMSERLCVLEMVNATPKPDGSREHFARRVPGTMQTAREAVAWTFNLTAEQYHPDVQT